MTSLSDYRRLIQDLRTQNMRQDLQIKELHEERQEFMKALMACASREVNHS